MAKYRWSTVSAIENDHITALRVEKSAQNLFLRKGLSRNVSSRVRIGPHTAKLHTSIRTWNEKSRSFDTINPSPIWRKKVMDKWSFVVNTKPQKLKECVKKICKWAKANVTKNLSKKWMSIREHSGLSSCMLSDYVRNRADCTVLASVETPWRCKMQAQDPSMRETIASRPHMGRQFRLRRFSCTHTVSYHHLSKSPEKVGNVWIHGVMQYSATAYAT